MKVVQGAAALLVAVAAVFAGLNWAAFTKPETVNLLVGRYEAPIGVVMLAALGLLSLVFLSAVGRIQISAWLESRGNLKELEQARRVATSKEDSRLRDMETAVREGFEVLNSRVESLAQKIEVKELSDVMRQEGDAIEERINKAERELHREFRHFRKPAAG